MLPELLKNITDVRDIRLKNLLAYCLEDNIAVVNKQKIRDIIGVIDLRVVEQGFEKLKSEGIIVSYFPDDNNSYKIEVAQDKIVDFMQLKAFYENYAEMKQVNLISAASFLRFWVLMKRYNYKDFTVNADELSSYLNMKKYQFAQTTVKDNKCFFDRLVENMSKAGFYLRYEFVNGKNIRLGIKFIFYQDKQGCGNDERTAIINKVQSMNLGKNVNKEDKKKKTMLAHKLAEVFENEKEYPVHKKIIKNLTLKENETLLYYLLNYISAKNIE